MDQAAQLRPGFFALAVRRRWRLIVAGALLGVLAGIGALTQLPVTYTSQSSLFLNPLVGNPYAPDVGTGRTDQLTALQTEAELVPTTRVSELAIAVSAVELPASPEDRLSVVVPSNSQVVTLSFTASKPEVATAGAQAFAEAYLQYRSLRAAESNASLAERLRADLATNATVIDDTQTEIEAAEPGSSSELNLREQLTVYSQQQAQLRLSFNEATAAVPPAGEVISPATAALSPSGLPAWLVLVAALLVGLGLGGVLALAREHSDDRLRDADELTVLGVGHALATVPLSAGGFPLDRPAPRGYRLLLTGVIARTGVEAPITCVVGRPEAAKNVAAGLGGAAYRLGKSAVVVGVEAPQRWKQATVLPAETMADARALTPAAQKPTLMVVPLDLSQDAAEEFVLSAALPRFVAGARTTGTVVSMAGGTSASAAGQQMASIADLTVVVVELGRDTFSEIVEVVETLHESGVDHVGIVVAQPDRKRRGWFGRRRRAETSAPPLGPPASSPTDAAPPAGRPANATLVAARDVTAPGETPLPPREVTAPGSARR